MLAARGRCRWFVDETYVKVAGRWRYVYRAVDQHGHIIDAFVSPRRDTASARRFFEAVLGAHGMRVEVVTDRAPTLRSVIEELMPDAFHNAGQYANNRIEADHGRLKARLRPMRGLKRELHRTRGHARSRAVTRSCRTSSAATLRARRRRPNPSACHDRVLRTRPDDLNRHRPRRALP
jgi:transposase-like protein